MSVHDRLVLTMLAMALVAVLSVQSAYAYVDAGTGSYILQVVVAGVLAGAFVIKAFWRNLKEKAGRLFGRKSSE